MNDFAAIDAQIEELEAYLENTREVSDDEELLTGVDLGTAYIVVVVLNKALEPVAYAMEFAQVLKDGIVVDYIGATTIVKRLVNQLEERLGRSLDKAAIAVPPGTGSRDCATHKHVVEASGLTVINILDEPTAANAVLNIENGVIVDIGGGTTGLSILKDGKVVYVADEPTGGTHLSLVLAGSYGIPFDEAEKMKKQNSKHKEIFPVVAAVVEKMGTIVRKHIQNHEVSAIYLVGGTCCLENMEKVIAKETGLPVHKPKNPLLVTPLGIAMNCKEGNL